MKKIITLLATGLLAFALTACTTGQRQATGIVGGGVVGGIAGSALTGGSAVGTAVGAVGGAFVGNALAK